MKKLTAFLLSILLIVACMAPVAHAATVPESYRIARVWVNDKEVTNITIYITKNDNVLLYNYSDLFKLFPAECEKFGLAVYDKLGLIDPEKFRGTALSEWCDIFGYSQSLYGSNVFIEKITDTEPSKPTVPPSVPSTPLTPSIPSTPTYQQGTVFVNGLKVDSADVYFDRSGNVCLGSSRTLINIFPEKPYTFKAGDSMYLRDWATKYGYSMAQREKRVYLWNYQNNPMEVYLDGKYVEFPDQQPFTIDGRTVVPVRAISEALGWTVEFENTSIGGMVRLIGNNHFVIFYINYKVFYVDGRAYSMDVAPQIVNGRTVIPLRFAAEALGLTVGYDGSTSVKVVTLTSKK